MVMGKQRRRMIETVLPLKEIGYEASKEKSLRKGQIISLHIWWSRNPLIAARLSIIASLIDAPSSNEDKNQLDELVKGVCSRKRRKDSLIQGKELIISNRGSSKIKFLDSFAGGGSIPLEALRLGCESYSLDLNPVSYIIQLCTIKYPQEYGGKDSRDFFQAKSSRSKSLEEDVMFFGNLIHKNVLKKLGGFYQGNANEIISHYLWARTIICPNPSCERTVPLMKNFWLVKKKKRTLAFKLEDKGGSFSLRITERIDFNPEEGTISQGNLRCPFCHQGADVSYVRKESQSDRLGSHLAAVCYFNKSTKLSKEFREPQKTDFLVVLSFRY